MRVSYCLFGALRGRFGRLLNCPGSIPVERLPAGRLFVDLALYILLFRLATEANQRFVPLIIGNWR